MEPGRYTTCSKPPMAKSRKRLGLVLEILLHDPLSPRRRLVGFEILLQTKKRPIKYAILSILLFLVPFVSFALGEPTPKQQVVQKIAYYAYHAGLPESLVIEIARCESGWNQSAVSKTLDYGVMQISKKYNGELAKKLGFDINKTEDNIRFGIFLIKEGGAYRHYSASYKSCWGKTFPF